MDFLLTSSPPMYFIYYYYLIYFFPTNRNRWLCTLLLVLTVQCQVFLSKCRIPKSRSNRVNCPENMRSFWHRCKIRNSFKNKSAVVFQPLPYFTTSVFTLLPPPPTASVQPVWRREVRPTHPHSPWSGERNRQNHRVNLWEPWCLGQQEPKD